MSEIETSAEAVERLAAERDEKAAESFGMAAILRQHDKDATGWFMAGEYAALTAATLRALLSDRDALAARLAQAEAALREVERLLVNAQPQIAQHAGANARFIDNYVEPAIGAIRAALAQAGRGEGEDGKR